MRLSFLALITFFQTLHGEALLDLESQCDPFVLESKRIEIDGFPNAFNPSVIRWKGRLLLSFRTLPDLKDKFKSDIYLVYLNDDFEPVSTPQKIHTNHHLSNVPSRMDDPRLIEVNGSLMMVYSDCKDVKVTRGGFRVYSVELQEEESGFFALQSEGYFDFEGASSDLREKNWVPFEYEGFLLLSYSLEPHKVFFPLKNCNKCETVALSQTCVDWDWGVLRGGTPAVAISDTLYLSFFHSSKMLASVHSDGLEVLHYVMGAYTFSRTPPFEIRAMSKKPIVGKNFYHGPKYTPYWHPVRVVFPCGVLVDDEFIWVTYGRQDHEAWVTKLDKKGLLESLSLCRSFYR